MAATPALTEAAICVLNLDPESESMVAEVASRPQIRGALWPFVEHAALVVVDADAESGPETAGQARLGDATVPILILARDLNEVRGLAAIEKVDFLTKPLIPEILAARLAILIRPEKRQSLPVVSLLTDASGKVLSIHRATEDLLAGAIENVRDLIPNWEPAESDEDRTVRDKEGIEFPARVISSPKHRNSREEWAVFVLDRRRVKQVPNSHHEDCAQCLRDLDRKRERLRQFANAIGHDFQEPLRMVVSYSQLVEQRYGTQLDEQAQPLMEFAVQGAIRIHALLQALCECMEMESAGHTTTDVDCEEALDKALAALRETILASRATIKRGKLPRVSGDPEKLEEVFRRLIDNAIKFNSSPTPIVQISAEQDPDNWTISVQDNGIGIEPLQMERAFRIFKRLNGSKYPGDGIGLTLCSTIVERHGGDLWAESVPGQGSTFRFTLPRHS